jgi:hypothetical protein
METDSSGVIVELIIGFVFGLILSWSVGILPAIIYRYAIFKKPIEKKKVFWRLAPIVVVLMFAFKLTMAELSGTQPNPNPIPWVIIYYIDKWIMTRQSKRKAESDQPPQLGHSMPPPQVVASTAPSTPKRRMHGCLLAFLIALGLLVIGLPVGIYIGGKAFMDYAKQSMESSPLCVAVVVGKLDQVDLLLSQGENPNQKGPMGHSPLIMATDHGHAVIAEHLLKAGADPNQKDNLQWAPLHHAIKTDHARLDMISILVRHGADVNVTDKHLRTPLHRAAQFGHVDAVRLLISLGAQPNAVDENGWTPFDRAEKHPQIQTILQEAMKRNK